MFYNITQYIRKLYEGVEAKVDLQDLCGYNLAKKLKSEAEVSP